MKRIYCITDPKNKLLIQTVKHNKSICICSYAELMCTTWESLLKDGYRCVPLKVIREKK